MKNKVVNVKLNSYQMFPEKQLTNITTQHIPWGLDNAYPYFLEGLLNKSSIHANIQYGKADLTLGKGLTWDSTNLISAQQAAISKLYYSPNGNETLDELIMKLILDYIIYGQNAIQIIWSKDRNSIAEIYHVPMGKLRFEKPDMNGEIKNVLYSDNWLQYRKSQFAPEKIKLFDLADRQDPRQIIITSQYNVGSPIYSQPQYSASIPYILTDWHVAQYNLNTAQSSLSPDFILNISGLQTEEEQNDFYDTFENDFMNSTGAKVLVTFAENKDMAPTLQTVESNNQDKYIQLTDTVNSQILIANKVVSPLLVGIKTEGQLGGNTELQTAFRLYYEQTIKQIQNAVIKPINSKILKINGVSGDGYVFINPELMNLENNII